MEIYIKVESAADFSAAYGVESNKIQGQPMSRLRLLPFAPQLWAIERHGYRGFSFPKFDASGAIEICKHLEAFRTRRRDFDKAEKYLKEYEELCKVDDPTLGPVERKARQAEDLAWQTPTSVQGLINMLGKREGGLLPLARCLRKAGAHGLWPGH